MSQSKERAIDRLSPLHIPAGGAFAELVVLRVNHGSAPPASVLSRGNATVFSPAHHERWLSRPLTLSLSKGVSGLTSLPLIWFDGAHHERAREAGRAGEGERTRQGRAPFPFRHSSGSGSPSPTTGSGPLRRRAAPLISFDKLRMSGWEFPLVVSLSNHTSGQEKEGRTTRANCHSCMCQLIR